MSTTVTFDTARAAHADARWKWHLARERGQFSAMLDAEIKAQAAVEHMEAALAGMGFDRDFCEQAVSDFLRENEEWAAVAPFWGRIARGEQGAP